MPKPADGHWAMRIASWAAGIRDRLRTLLVVAGDASLKCGPEVSNASWLAHGSSSVCRRSRTWFGLPLLVSASSSKRCPVTGWVLEFREVFEVVLDPPPPPPGEYHIFIERGQWLGSRFVGVGHGRVKGIVKVSTSLVAVGLCVATVVATMATATFVRQNELRDSHESLTKTLDELATWSFDAEGRLRKLLRKFTALDNAVRDLQVVVDSLEERSANAGSASTQGEFATEDDEPFDVVLPDGDFRILNVDEMEGMAVPFDDLNLGVAGQLPSGEHIFLQYREPLLDPVSRDMAESVLTSYVNFFYGREQFLEEQARSGRDVRGTFSTRGAASAFKKDLENQNMYSVVRHPDGFAVVGISEFKNDREYAGLLRDLVSLRQRMVKRGFKQKGAPIFPPSE